MSQSDIWGPMEEALSTVASRATDELGRTLLHGHPFVYEGVSTTKRALHPLEQRGAQVHADTTYALIRHYDDTTHDARHYDLTGKLVHVRSASGSETRLSDSYYTNTTTTIDPVTNIPVPPYWHLKDSVTPYTGATFPHEELWYAPADLSGPFLVRWNGLDSHGLQFQDGTKYQFNPLSLQLPSGRKIDDSIVPTNGQALIYSLAHNTWEPGTGGTGDAIMSLGSSLLVLIPDMNSFISVGPSSQPPDFIITSLGDVIGVYGL